jgi:hypothetical protein
VHKIKARTYQVAGEPLVGLRLIPYMPTVTNDPMQPTAIIPNATNKILRPRFKGNTIATNIRIIPVIPVIMKVFTSRLKVFFVIEPS